MRLHDIQRGPNADHNPPQALLMLRLRPMYLRLTDHCVNHDAPDQGPIRPLIRCAHPPESQFARPNAIDTEQRRAKVTVKWTNDIANICCENRVRRGVQCISRHIPQINVIQCQTTCLNQILKRLCA